MSRPRQSLHVLASSGLLVAQLHTIHTHLPVLMASLHRTPAALLLSHIALNADVAASAAACGTSQAVCLARVSSRSDTSSRGLLSLAAGVVWALCCGTIPPDRLAPAPSAEAAEVGNLQADVASAACLMMFGVQSVQVRQQE